MSVFKRKLRNEAKGPIREMTKRTQFGRGAKLPNEANLPTRPEIPNEANLSARTEMPNEANFYFNGCYDDNAR
jgi:hypothetical protein